MDVSMQAHMSIETPAPILCNAHAINNMQGIPSVVEDLLPPVWNAVKTLIPSEHSVNMS